jgi:CRISPR-associated protein Cas5d
MAAATIECGVSAVVSVRLWGHYALFKNPIGRADPVTYPVPTPGVIRGAVEAIYRKPEMYYTVERIAVIKRGEPMVMKINEVTKAPRLDDVLKGIIRTVRCGAGHDDYTQRTMTILCDVEYVATLTIRPTERGLTDWTEPPGALVRKHQEIFRRKARSSNIERDQPYFGRREFIAWFEPVDDSARVQPLDWTEDFGLMLYDQWHPDSRRGGEPVGIDPVFYDARVERGVIDCSPDRVQLFRVKGA